MCNRNTVLLVGVLKSMKTLNQEDKHLFTTSGFFSRQVTQYYFVSLYSHLQRGDIIITSFKISVELFSANQIVTVMDLNVNLWSYFIPSILTFKNRNSPKS